MTKLLEHNDVDVPRRLKKLPVRCQAAFAAACAQRIFPGWVAYAKRREIDATSLGSVLEELWTSLIGDMRDATALSAASATCAAELDLMSDDEAEQREWRPEDDFAQNGASSTIRKRLCVHRRWPATLGTRTHATISTGRGS